MIQNIHISGALNRAIFLKDGDYFLKRLDQPSIPARHFDINSLLQFGGDIIVLKKTKENQLNELIQEQSDLQGGLSLAIKGIAPREPINDKFRQPSIELLEEFLEDRPVYEFVHTRMMSKAATEDTDISEALRIAQAHNYTKATQLYTDLQAAQPTLQSFWKLWKQATYDMPEEEVIEIEDELVESGIITNIIQKLSKLESNNEEVIIFSVRPNYIDLIKKIITQFLDKGNVSHIPFKIIPQYTPIPISPIDENKEYIFHSELMPQFNEILELASFLTGDEEDAKYLVQETYINAYKLIDSYRVGSNPKAWLFHILYNEFNREYRKKSKSSVFKNHTEELTVKEKLQYKDKNK